MNDINRNAINTVEKGNFLNYSRAVIIKDNQEFTIFSQWLNEANLFLSDGTPAGNMKYPGNGTIVMYRDKKDGFIYWGLIYDVDQKKYKLMSVTDFFKFDNVVIDAEATEVVELIGIDDMPEFQVLKVTPGHIESNVSIIKSQVIPAILQYKNTVVTKENFKDIKKLVTRLNAGYKSVNSYRIDTVKEVNKDIVVFEQETKEIAKTFNETAVHLKEQINVFEEEEKEARKAAKITKIEAIKENIISAGMLRKEFTDKFEYNDSWSNSSCTDKKFQEDVNTQFNMLVEQQKNYDEAITTIKQMIVNAEVPEGMMQVDRYIQLYNTGKALADIITMIARDAEQLKSQLEKQKKEAVESAREDIKKEVIEEQQQHQEQIEVTHENVVPVSQNPAQTMHVDEKTGEVIGKSTEKMICVDIQQGSSKFPEDKIFKYVYQFEGNYKAIRTFSMFLKVLKKINSTFNFKGTLLKEEK